MLKISKIRSEEEEEEVVVGGDGGDDNKNGGGHDVDGRLSNHLFRVAITTSIFLNVLQNCAYRIHPRRTYRKDLPFTNLLTAKI
jgi:hypothetical protein